MKNLKGDLGLLVTAIIWGIGFVATEIALGALTPFDILAVRFAVGALVLFLIFHKHLKNLAVATMKRGVALGALLYVSFLLQTVGLLYTTPANNAFLTAVNVIIVPFIGVLLYKRKIDRFGVIGAVLACVGVALISLTSALTVSFGDALTLLCAVGFAFQIFYTAEFLKKGDDPIALAILQLAACAVLAAVVCFITHLVGFDATKGESSLTDALLATLFLGVLSTGGAYLLQTVSQKFTTETRAAVILCTESVFGALFSAFILSQYLSPRTIVGCAIVLLAVIVSEIRPFSRKT